ncbi:universal stress protein [Micromonospora sp. NBC_00898]|uniref:universal stress protein n=1 Tax=Micromonospora sp. NBC_00898 TaxID=2975981 RepID=UPI003869D7F6|nr:universal stress protein [Micromonospora sp. NBC_00898]
MLVGVDASPASIAAVELAADEAAARVTPLVIVHVYAGPIRRPTGACAPEWVDPMAVQRRLLEGAVAGVRAEHPGLAVSGELLSGDPAGVLAGRSLEACLLVLGHRRRCGLSMASVATSVPVRVHVPVIVHRPLDRHRKSATDPRPVIVGVNGEEGAESVVEFAFLEASLRGAPLTALLAWSQPAGAIPAGVHPDVCGFAEARAEAERMLAETLAGWSEKYPEVPVRRIVRHTLDASMTLTEASRSAQLVVVGSPRKRGLSRLLLGSVSQALTDHAGCPVAVVPVTERTFDTAPRPGSSDDLYGR